VSDENEPRDEIELISDGSGFAVIGDAAAVDRFLSSAGVASRDSQLTRKLGGASAPLPRRVAQKSPPTPVAG